MIKRTLIESRVDDEYNRNYSSIDRDIFNQILEMDPKTNKQGDEILGIGPNAKQLLLPKYMAGEDFLRKGNQIYSCLETYLQNRGTYPAKYKNLSNFTSVQEFIDFVEDPEKFAQAGGEETITIIEDDPITKIYNKYYNDIPREDFDKIIALDSKTTKKSIGEVAKQLLLPKYKAGEKNFINNSNTKRAINNYYDLKSENKLPEGKDQISSYQTVDEFIKFILEGPKSQLETELFSNENIDVETHRPVKDDIVKIASTQDYDIFEPKSQLANYAIGGGYRNTSADMGWCTGWHPEHGEQYLNYWHEYTQRGGRIFCFMKKGAHRGQQNRLFNWQIAVRNNTVTDFYAGWNQSCFGSGTADERFTRFLISKPDILLAIKDKDPFDKMRSVEKAFEQVKFIDEPFILNKNTVRKLLLTKNDLKFVVKEVIVENIKKVPEQAFSDFISLKKVTFNEGLEEIGVEAFKNCSALLKFDLPESLKIIGDAAFMNCTQLKGTIKLPDNLEELKPFAFANDSITLSINKNRTTKLKVAKSDENWIRAHIKGINV